MKTDPIPRSKKYFCCICFNSVGTAGHYLPCETALGPGKALFIRPTPLSLALPYTQNSCVLQQRRHSISSLIFSNFFSRKRLLTQTCFLVEVEAEEHLSHSPLPRQLHESPLNHIPTLNASALFIDLRSVKADFSTDEMNDFLKDLGCKGPLHFTPSHLLQDS